MSTAALPLRHRAAPTTPASAPRVARAGSKDVGRRIVFWSCLLVYGLLGVWLIVNDYIFPDSMSRVANAYYVLFSRDPRLAAIGFVWNPLPSLAVLPLLVVAPVFKFMASGVLAGVIVSVLCGAATVSQTYRLLAMLGSGRLAQGVLTAAMALHPLIVLAAATGASEAMLLVTCLFVTIHLMLWLLEDDPWHLVLVGVGCGTAYFVRYEALAMGPTVGALVLAVSLARSRDRRAPRAAAMTDTLLAVAPLATAFIVWALMSRLIVGSWLETFTSEYGNTAQVGSYRTGIAAATGSTAVERMAHVVEQLANTAPLLLPVVGLAAWVAVMRNDPRIAAPLATFGAILGFQWLTFVAGSSFGWMRFQIAAIPLVVLASGYLAGSLSRAERTGGLVPPAGAGRRAASVAVVAALVLSLPVAWRALANPELAREEHQAALAVREGRYPMLRQAAAQIDGMGLPEGSIITDAAYTFPIILYSDRPKQFIITPDRDFDEVVDDPPAHGVSYALVADETFAPADSVRRRHPHLWDGGGNATLVAAWSNNEGREWRLYQFNP
ncbi:hypothetical protein [Actinomyces slackii]|uniref:hypothetical protein n=1 Tax=Actinomyces slackii TaxID=52774 RepID=UPI000685E6B5|nr:hypothetical protein [Actinomyces slackii]